MKQLQTLKQWLASGCVYFTACTFLMAFIRLIVSGEESAGMINVVSFLFFFPFGLAMSAAGMILCNKSLPRWSRYLLHYGITILSLYVFVWMPSNTVARPSTVLIVFVVFTVLYWLVFGLIQLIRSRIRKLMETD